MTPSAEVIRQNRSAALSHMLNAVAIIVLLMLAIAAIWAVAGILPSELTGH